jgi:YD repeat-containing protein
MTAKNHIIIALAVACLALSSSARAQTGGTANYFYDANGRLTVVLSPTGEAAIYSYDPAGNFTAITRRAANELSIVEFTPASGVANTPVTIYGTGFNTTPSANTVKFNGVTGAVTSATKTQLIVSVPSGATTGPINITNANGSVDSSRNFYVAASALEFTRSIVFGENAVFGFIQPADTTPLTKVGLLTFEGLAGQRVSLFVDDILPSSIQFSFPSYAQVSIISPAGVSLGTATVQSNTQLVTTFGYLETIVLPATGTYTILIDPNDLIGGFSQPGQLAFGATAHLYDVPPDATGTLAATGLLTPVHFSTPGQNAVLSFNGLNGQRICLRASQDVSTLIGTDVKLFAPGAYPSGTPLVSQVLKSNFFIDATTLTANGVYTILLDPQLNKTRTALLNLYDVPPDVTGTLTIGAPPVEFSIPSVGQVAMLTFNVAATQSVTVQINGNFVGGDNLTAVSLLRSDNTVVTSTTSSSIAFALTPQTLTAGAYRVKVDPQGTNAGNVSVNVSSP